MNKYDSKNVKLKRLEAPATEEGLVPVPLSDETISARIQKVIALMNRRKLDSIVVYADLEHGSNFEYLTGFLPRFEEALLVLHNDGTAYLLLGNECLKMGNYSRIKAKSIHVPYFSLPNQPMDGDQGLKEPLLNAGLLKGKKTGLIGWKYFTSQRSDNRTLYDLPHYITEALFDVIGRDNIENACDLFVNADYGARTTNNANEIAHYEFGAALSGSEILQAQNAIEIGKSEMEIARNLMTLGQRNNVVSICATGDRFEKANLYPTDKKIKLGDKMSLTVGYKGGLTSRAGYAVNHAGELPEGVKDYLQKLAAPYYTSTVAWLEQIRIGMTGQEMVDLINEVLPKSIYGWTLNPGHLTADEEWLSSPFYPDSTETLKSGMLLQLDIIPSMQGYGGTGAESGIALADAELREEIKRNYPAVWGRIEQRRKYMIEVLNIQIGEEVLPLSSMVGYYRPFLLNKSEALYLE